MRTSITMKMKRILAIFIVVSLMLGIMPMAAFVTASAVELEYSERLECDDNVPETHGVYEGGDDVGFGLTYAQEDETESRGGGYEDIYRLDAEVEEGDETVTEHDTNGYEYYEEDGLEGVELYTISEEPTLFAASGAPAPRHKTVSAGEQHTMAIRADGTLWGWGNGANGRLGDGTTNQRLVPTQVGTATNWVHVSAGQAHTMAIRADGSLWGWGNGGNGRLGDGETGVTNSTPLHILPNYQWAYVSAGWAHTMAIRADGSLWGWGNGASGRLGDGRTGTSNHPDQVPNPDGVTGWAYVSVGEMHTMAIDTNGRLWGWGGGGNGRLGDGGTATQNTPIQIPTEVQVNTNPALAPLREGGWTSVSAGQAHTMAIRADGSLWGWGNGGGGRLGNGGTGSTHNTPLQIPSAAMRESNPELNTGWYSVSAGWAHTMAIRTDGTLWAWGNGGTGRLGDGRTGTSNHPAQAPNPNPLGVTSWSSVSAANLHTMAVCSGGLVWNWGSGANGRLGRDLTAQTNFPVLPAHITIETPPTPINQIFYEDQPITGERSVGGVTVHSFQHDPAPAFQWQRDVGGGVWQDIPGENSTSLDLATAGIGMGENLLRVVVSSVPGVTEQNRNVTVTVLPLSALDARNFAELQNAILRGNRDQATGPNFTGTRTVRIMDDITMDAPITINAGFDITLISGNPGGVTLTRSTVGTNVQGNMRHFTVQSAGSLTLGKEAGDCTAYPNNFTLTGATFTGNVDAGGGSVGLVNAGRLYMHGGTISGNSTNASGGAVTMVGGNSTFTMTGGVIRDNTAGANGGGVLVSIGTIFNMTGGIIEDNSANGTGNNGLGGGIRINIGGAADNNFNMTGGIIRNNHANINAGGVSIGSDIITVGGTARIYGNTRTADNLPSNVWLDRGAMVLALGTGDNAPAPGMSVGVTKTATTAGNIVIVNTGAVEEHENFFFADCPSRMVVHSDGQLRLVDSEMNLDVRNFTELQNAILRGDRHRNAGENANVPGTRTVRIMNDITMTGAIQAIAIGAGFDITLISGNPDGVTLTREGTGTGRHFTVQNAGRLTLGKETGNCTAYPNNFTLTGATYTAHTPLTGGGAVGVDHTGGSLYMHGGTISGNSSLTDGGGVTIFHTDSTFTMTGGIISGNTANNGGGVAVSGGSMSMYGGVIENNSATGTGHVGAGNNGHGGGVLLAGHATSTMTGGRISGNTAVNGGGVFLRGTLDSTGTFTMRGGVIENNRATGTGNNGRGGGVGLASQPLLRFNMTGGIMRNNHANTNAGGLSIAAGTLAAPLTTVGGTARIYGNTRTAEYLPSNVWLDTAARVVALGTGNDAPAPGMSIGVTKTLPATGDIVIVNTGAIAGQENFFFADDPSRAVTYSNGQILFGTATAVNLENATADGTTNITTTTQVTLTFSEAVNAVIGTDNITITNTTNPGRTVTAAEVGGSGNTRIITIEGEWDNGDVIEISIGGIAGYSFPGAQTATLHMYVPPLPHLDVYNFTELRNAILRGSRYTATGANVPGARTVRIMNDIAMTEQITIPAGLNITLISGNDGPGGVTLDRGLTPAEAGSGGRHFVIGSGGVLTLGRGNHGYTEGPNNFTLTGGAARTVAPSIASVRVNGGGRLYMYGGQVSGNFGFNSGGAVGVFGNAANDAVFTMRGGIISDNTTPHNGGGVIVSTLSGTHNGTFIMEGGIIENNTAGGVGGGVRVINDARAFTMTGGVIRNNSAGVNAGGVSITGGTLTGPQVTLGGTARIYGNTVDGNPNNVFLDTATRVIRLGTGANAPAPGMSVGVTKTAPLDGNIVIVNTGASAGDAQFFSADDPARYVYHSGGQLRLSAPTIIDRSELRYQIERAEAQNEANYTPPSWNVMQTMLNIARRVYNNQNATQAQINSTANDMRRFIDSLVVFVPPVIDRTALAYEIARAETHDQENYTFISWRNVQRMLETARNVYDNQDVTQALINSAANNLRTSIDALVVYVPTVIVIDRSTLAYEIERAEARNQADYTVISWRNVQRMLETARNVYDNQDATQALINSSANNLRTRIDALVPM